MESEADSSGDENDSSEDDDAKELIREYKKLERERMDKKRLN